jgi:hypothetical protein
MSGVDGWTLGVGVAIPGVVFVTAIVWGWRDWRRTAPLRQQMRGQPITFQTVLFLVRFPDSRPFGSGTNKQVRLIIRGDLVQVGPGVPGLACCYFRAPETAICVSRNPPRIMGIVRRDEWIVVSSRQDGHVLVSMTDRAFSDEVWNALVIAGAHPTSSGPSRRTKL